MNTYAFSCGGRQISAPYKGRCFVKYPESDKVSKSVTDESAILASHDVLVSLRAVDTRLLGGRLALSYSGFAPEGSYSGVRIRGLPQRVRIQSLPQRVRIRSLPQWIRIRSLPQKVRIRSLPPFVFRVCPRGFVFGVFRQRVRNHIFF